MADFNVDDFVSGFRAATQKVTIFQRPDLAGEINHIERQIELIESERSDDASLSDDDGADELREQRDALTRELEDSAHTFVLQALGRERVDAITEEARKACKDRADDAAKKARAWAKEQLARDEEKDPQAIKDAMRQASQAAARAIISHEEGLHILAAALIDPVLTVDQVRRISEVMGEGQVHKLQTAFYELTSRDPEASIPKSSRNGTTVEENSL